MNQLASVGLILLVSLIAGHLVKFARVPEVTGYIIAGMVLGPSMLGWIREDNIAALQVLSDVALGLIMFSIGSIFNFDRFSSIRRDVFIVTAMDTVLTFASVGTAMVLLGQGWKVSMVLAAVAVETAAASTLMVMREYDASGPLTETLTGVIAVNNLICLTLFSLIVDGIQMTGDLAGVQSPVTVSLYRPVYLLVWQFLGAVALGYLIGALLALWAPRVVEQGETLILLIGCIVLSIGAATLLDVSPLIASLAVGATSANFSTHSRRLANVQSSTDPPLYAIFFVIAGANLHLSLLKTLGWVGAAYVGARALSKFAAPAMAARFMSLPGPGRREIRYAMLTHAGLAIGLVLSLQTRMPALSAKVTTIVLSAILVYELVGPISTRFALIRSGEARHEVTGDEDVLA